MRAGRGARSSKGISMSRNSASRATLAALAVVIAVAAPTALAQDRPAGSAGGASSAAAADECPNASETVSETTLPDLRKTIRCLISAERVARGYSKLTRTDSLEIAAKRHVRTMIETNCLAHKCPGEVDLEHRLRRAGYIDGTAPYRFAESTGCGMTAQSMVSSWLASPFDRANIFDPGFEDIGVAVSQESSAQLCADGYGTFAVVFGARLP
jgi:uncharacterized protein YkwD